MPSAASALRASVLAAAILATPMLAEARKLDPALERMLPATAAHEKLQVIVSFHGEGAPTSAQKQVLAALGLPSLTLRSLPIAGTLANKAQIQALLARPEVRSVWFNAALDYDNKEATELTGVDRLRSDRAIRLNGMPVSGKGVGVLVNDSGVDGTHPDMQFGPHLVQNVAGQTNLASLNGDTGQSLPITYTENVANTDIGGGHGTHVAGTIGGNGAFSGGAQEGVAPGASMIGYGSGAVLLILDTLGGFDYALTHQAQYNIRVISNSFGNNGDVATDFDPDDPTNIATKKLADRGVVVVFSAGNQGAGGAGTITGNFKKAPWVIATGATDKAGKLAAFSSRGRDGVGGTVTVDGEEMTWVDRPTASAPGVDIVSLRASLGSTDKLSAQKDAALGAMAARYSHSSGTSMSAPHMSGIVALILEANPNLDWRGVKQIIEKTATNIPGRKPWEGGAGFVNAYAAVQMARESSFDYGATVNAARGFNASALLLPGTKTVYPMAYTPVVAGQVQSFTVGGDVALVTAQATASTNTNAIWLTAPNGTVYKSSVSTPVLGASIGVSAPGMAGTWSMTLKGTQSGTGTNGAGAPATLPVTVTQVRSGGYTGLGDIAGHGGRGFVEFAIGNRLMDGYADGTFQPDRTLTRGEMADYLAMGAGIRQKLPNAGASSFTDVARGSAQSGSAEAVTATGSSLRDVTQVQAGVMAGLGGQFRPADAVTRVSLAYSLVQSLGLQATATVAPASLTVAYDGKRIAIEDAGAIDPALRGYVQLALDLGLLPARFAVTQGEYDLAPVLRAYFDPSLTVSRAGFAAAASRRFNAYGL